MHKDYENTFKFGKFVLPERSDKMSCSDHVSRKDISRIVQLNNADRLSGVAAKIPNEWMDQLLSTLF